MADTDTDTATIDLGSRQQQQSSPTSNGNNVTNNWAGMGLESPLPDSPHGYMPTPSDAHLSTVDKLTFNSSATRTKSRSKSRSRSRTRSGVAAWALEEGEIRRGNTPDLAVSTTSPALGTAKRPRVPDSATALSASSAGSSTYTPQSAADHLMAQFASTESWTQPLRGGETNGNASSSAWDKDQHQTLASTLNVHAPSWTNKSENVEQQQQQAPSAPARDPWGQPSDPWGATSSNTDTAASGGGDAWGAASSETASQPTRPTRRTLSTSETSGTAAPAARTMSVQEPTSPTDPSAAVRPRVLSTGAGRLLFLETKATVTPTAVSEKNAWASALESAATATGLDEYRPKPLPKRDVVPGPPALGAFDRPERGASGYDRPERGAGGFDRTERGGDRGGFDHGNARPAGRRSAGETRGADADAASGWGATESAAGWGNNNGDTAAASSGGWGQDAATTNDWDSGAVSAKTETTKPATSNDWGQDAAAAKPAAASDWGQADAQTSKDDWGKDANKSETRGNDWQSTATPAPATDKGTTSNKAGAESADAWGSATTATGWGQASDSAWGDAATPQQAQRPASPRRTQSPVRQKSPPAHAEFNKSADAFETMATDVGQALPKPETSPEALAPARAVAGDADPWSSGGASGNDAWGAPASGGWGEPTTATTATPPAAPSGDDWGSATPARARTARTSSTNEPAMAGNNNNDDDWGAGGARGGHGAAGRTTSKPADGDWNLPASSTQGTHGPRPGNARNDDPGAPLQRGSVPPRGGRAGGKAPNVIDRGLNEQPGFDPSAFQAGGHLSDERRKTAASRLMSMGFSTQREDAKQILDTVKASGGAPAPSGPAARGRNPSARVNPGGGDAWGANAGGASDWGMTAGGGGEWNADVQTPAPAPVAPSRGRASGAQEESDAWASAKAEGPTKPIGGGDGGQCIVETRKESNTDADWGPTSGGDNDWGKPSAPSIGDWGQASTPTQAKPDTWAASAGNDWNTTTIPAAAPKAKSPTRLRSAGAQAEADAWASATAGTAPQRKPAETAQSKPSVKQAASAQMADWDASATTSPQAILTSPPIRTHSPLSVKRNKSPALRAPSPAKIQMATAGASRVSAKPTAPSASMNEDRASAAPSDKDKGAADEPDVSPEEAYAAYYRHHGYEPPVHPSHYGYHSGYEAYDPYYSHPPPQHHHPGHYPGYPPQPHLAYYSHGSYPPPGPHAYPPPRAPYYPHHTSAGIPPPGGYPHHMHPPPPPHQPRHPARSMDAYGPPVAEHAAAHKYGPYTAAHHYASDPYARSWHGAGMPTSSGGGHDEVASQRSPSSARAQGQYRG